MGRSSTSLVVLSIYAVILHVVLTGSDGRRTGSIQDIEVETVQKRDAHLDDLLARITSPDLSAKITDLVNAKKNSSSSAESKSGSKSGSTSSGSTDTTSSGSTSGSGSGSAASGATSATVVATATSTGSGGGGGGGSGEHHSQEKHKSKEHKSKEHKKISGEKSSETAGSCKASNCVCLCQCNCASPAGSPASTAPPACAAASLAAAGVQVCPDYKCSCAPCVCPTTTTTTVPTTTTTTVTAAPVVVPVVVPATTTVAPATTTTTVITTTTTIPCPPAQWTQVGALWYYKSGQTLSWDAGEAFCQTCGAHLPAFHDATTWNSFLTYWASGATFWFGLNDKPPAAYGSRSYSDGTAFDYGALIDNDHKPGTGTGIGYCVRALQSMSYTWYDDGCDAPYGIVCERKTAPP